MSGKQLCPESSKGTFLRERGGLGAESGSVSRATEGLIQLPFSPGEDLPLFARPPGLPAPEARRPRSESTRYLPEAGLGPPLDFPSRRCGGGSPPVPTLQLLAASQIPRVPRPGRSDPLSCQSVYWPRPEWVHRFYKSHKSPPKRRVFPPRNRPVRRDFRELRGWSRLACQ